MVPRLLTPDPDGSASADLEINIGESKRHDICRDWRVLVAEWRVPMTIAPSSVALRFDCEPEGSPD
jgi:hypothetical protein